MKKWMTYFLTIIFSAQLLLTTPILTRIAEGWEVAAAVAFVYASDQAHKYQKKKEKKKEKNYTAPHYEPAPGYGPNDQYWNFEDIVKHYEEFRVEYSFLSDNPPYEAVASLPAHPVNGRSDTGIGIASNGSDAIGVMASTAIDFPWTEKKSILKKGDIIFTRADTAFSRAFQYVSSWVHAGVVLNPNNNEVFESYPADGVRPYNPLREWPKGYSWSVKRVKPHLISDAHLSQVIDRAKTRYTGKPYFPRYFASHRIRQEFISEFSDKHNTSSFYCTKLVWRVFKDAGIDLDSERTTAFVDSNFRHAYTDWGASNSFAWIGVSGDDIYYSKHLSTDIWTYGLENLNKPLPGWSLF